MLTFEEALVQAQALAERYETDKTALQEIAQLLQTPAGARGFFVVFLTGNFSHLEHPSLELLEILAQASGPVPELLVKNLVMSTAMTIVHPDPENVAESQKVVVRARTLLSKLPHCQPVVQQMHQSLTVGGGHYGDFLKKWGYNEDQKRLMAQALEGLIPHAS